ncbi:putative F420-0 ABC transporter substrate-binding protein [Cellulomonas sp. McL0617]|uniref:putative F420-0 ABC transporter substrate-binding protein n=1 Tax=Cellulomonas sp. McL0617 TaxID=3415675 RepID=UPI003CE6AA5D
MPAIRRVLVLAAAATLALAGCSTQSTPQASAPTTTASAAYTPVSLDNCGTKVTFDAAPTKVVTVKSTSTEMLLALGLQDTMVGTAFSDGPVPAAYTAAYDKIPVISDKVPGQEALLALAPDFVYGGWESNFSADGVGDRASLQGLGIGTYVSPSACKEPDYQPDPLTFAKVDDEIREVAAIFGVPDRAEALITREKATLASTRKPAEKTTALWYSSGSDTPYVGAGIGAPQMMMDAAGLTNIFAAVHDTWTSAGWESIVAADPSVIVLVDASWNTAASKIQMLESNPATAQLSAVKDHRYLTIPFAASEAGVRNAEAVKSLDDQLAALPT